MGDPTTSLDDALRARVEANLRGFRRLPVPRDGLRPAAVALALLADDEGEPCFVLTLRAAKMNNHAGQYALPGGRLDKGETAEQAALRELSEEVGLELPPVSVLGVLDDYPTRSGFVITPVVVWAGSAIDSKPNPREVAEVIRVRLEELDDPMSCTCARSRIAPGPSSPSRWWEPTSTRRPPQSSTNSTKSPSRAAKPESSTSNNPSSPGPERQAPA